MIVVVFRARRRAENEAAYFEEAARIGEIARTMPGYVSHKGFRAADGENVTIVEFETMADVEAWGRHPDHTAAKARGIAEFYEEYSIQIAEVVRTNSWPADAPPADGDRIVVTARCASPVAVVWRALIRERAGWWPDLDLDPVVGGLVRERWVEDGVERSATGTVTMVEHVEHGSCLAFEWTEPGWSGKHALVEIRVAPDGGGCTITVSERGLRAASGEPSLLDAHRAGWRHHVSALVAAAER